MEKFSLLGIEKSLEEKLSQKSITIPTSVQCRVIPLLLEGKSAVFRSSTGTGKTFAYLLPAIQRLAINANEAGSGARYQGPSILIIAPTLELCSQIKKEADFLLPQSSALLIGSVRMDRQIDTLKKSKPLIAVGNPGRLLALSKMGKLNLKNLRFLVLDEADRLTVEESIEETIELLSRIENNNGLTIAACSATVSKKTTGLLGNVFNNSEYIECDEHEILRERIEHWAFFSERRQKIQTLRSLLAAIKSKKPKFKALVFTASGDEAEKVASNLKFHNVPAAGLFGKSYRKPMDTRERKKAYELFLCGNINVLVSTDLAARGLDVPDLSHIIALDVPADSEIYTHRAGRTGRAGRKGKMISIGDESQLRRLASLEKKLKIIVRPKQLYRGLVCDPD